MGTLQIFCLLEPDLQAWVHNQASNTHAWLHFNLHILLGASRHCWWVNRWVIQFSGIDFTTLCLSLFNCVSRTCASVLMFSSPSLWLDMHQRTIYRTSDKCCRNIILCRNSTSLSNCSVIFAAVVSSDGGNEWTQMCLVNHCWFWCSSACSFTWEHLVPQCSILSSSTVLPAAAAFRLKQRWDINKVPHRIIFTSQ